MSRDSYLVICKPPNGFRDRWVIYAEKKFLEEGIILKERDGSMYRILKPPRRVRSEVYMVVDVEPA